ncbi:hypothetical protein ATANTOWER_001114 [Ataeniobius toweri]|uniref:Uncharacterized protein n=1 Tax=Ataeniobius toweri TaxID=208326 RepID=A0ABU7A1F7_9TELE|nr:hypothetical protein [Ataeniobius toweri]
MKPLLFGWRFSQNLERFNLNPQRKDKNTSFSLWRLQNQKRQAWKARVWHPQQERQSDSRCLEAQRLPLHLTDLAEDV